MLQADKIHPFAEADNEDDSFDVPDSPPMLTGEEAALYASIHAGEQVAGINDTTQQLIADAVEQGIEDSLGVDGTAQLIRATLGDMTRSRSKTIASTEMNDAFSEAAMRKLDRLGVEYKRWITSAGNCCDDCTDNEDAGAIPISDPFPSSDDRPPAHPNCFPPGTPVVSLGGVQAAMSRWYEGEIVNIGVEGQDKISPSINHPILTLRRMIPAGELQKGDYFVATHAGPQALSAQAIKTFQPASMR